jgi:predicted NACHT family NTPase
MVFFEGPLIAAATTWLTTQAIDTVKEVAGDKVESRLGKLLNQDITKLFQNRAKQYIEHYQERHGQLKVVCAGMSAPVRLEEIYTAVQLLDRSALRYFESAETLEQLFRESGKRGFKLGKEQQKQPGIKVANDEQYLMALGGPGVGKSTFLRRMGLEAWKGRKGDYQYKLIPVFLELKQFNSSQVTIEELIAKEFDVCGFPEATELVKAWLNQGKLLVLLDGLDEVPTDTVNWAIEQIRGLVDRYSKNRFIASCRVAAYHGGFDRFRDVAMAEFEDEQIQQFITNWFRAEKDLQANTAQNCWELLNQDGYRAVKELAQTPLLLTLLCVVYDQSLDFPRNRASLYGEALDVLLKKWASEKRVQRDPIYKDLTPELEQGLLAEIAYESFVVDQLFFPKAQVIDQIKACLVDNLKAPQWLDGEKVLKAIEVQQGILVERARDSYSFSHLTFQEYLTAFRIDDRRETDWLVENHLTDERWREVFLLVTGLMGGQTSR